MSDRRLPTPLASTPNEMIMVLAQRVAELESQVAALQASQARMLPGDYRFVALPDGTLRVLRVSTGGTANITGPL